MVNYRSHARDSGLTGDIPPTFFRKASGSVSGPHDTIVRPAHVKFLDYEVEVGLVLGAPCPWAPSSRSGTCRATSPASS